MKDSYSFGTPLLQLVIGFSTFIWHVRENKGQLLIWNTLITPGDSLRTFIRHVRENKGQLLIRNTLITPGDSLRTFIRHVRDNKGQLLIRNTFITTGNWFFYFYMACEGK